MDKICKCCGQNQLSEDPEAAEQELCDLCWRELGRRDQDDFIGYRKGE